MCVCVNGDGGGGGVDRVFVSPSLFRWSAFSEDKHFLECGAVNVQNELVYGQIKTATREVGFKLSEEVSVCVCAWMKTTVGVGWREREGKSGINVFSFFCSYVYKYVEFIDMVECRLERLIGLEVSELLRPNV